jgi:hypothetical protein
MMRPAAVAEARWSPGGTLPVGTTPAAVLLTSKALSVTSDPRSGGERVARDHGSGRSRKADGGAGDHENFTISKLMGFENSDDETAAMTRAVGSEESTVRCGCLEARSRLRLRRGRRRGRLHRRRLVRFVFPCSMAPVCLTRTDSRLRVG